MNRIYRSPALGLCSLPIYYGLNVEEWAEWSEASSIRDLVCIHWFKAKTIDFRQPLRYYYFPSSFTTDLHQTGHIIVWLRTDLAELHIFNIQSIECRNRGWEYIFEHAFPVPNKFKKIARGFTKKKSNANEQLAKLANSIQALFCRTRFHVPFWKAGKMGRDMLWFVKIITKQ